MIFASLLGSGLGSGLENGLGNGLGSRARWSAAALVVGQVVGLIAALVGSGMVVLPASAAGRSALETVLDRVSEFMSEGDLTAAAVLCDSVLGARSFDVIARSELQATARLLQSRGFLFYLQEDFDAALPWYERAHALIVGQLRPSDHEAGSLAAEITSDFAELLRLTGHTQRASESLHEAVRLATAHARNEPLYAVTLNNLAGVYKDQSEFARAEGLLKEALRATVALAGGPSERLATAHLNLAEVYRLQHRHAFAEPHYRSALAIAREVLGSDDADLVYFLGQMAAQRSEQGSRDEAMELRAECLAILERAPRSTRFLEAELLRAMGEDLLAVNRADEAVAVFERSVRGNEELFGGEHWITAQSRLGLARAFARSEPSRSDEAHTLLDAMIANIGEAAPEVLIAALGLRAALLGERGRTVEAIADLDRALGGMEQLRRVRGGGERSRAMLLGDNIDLYHQMIRARMERGELRIALSTLERMRARTLLDEIERSELDLRADLSEAVRDSFEARERKLRGELARHQDAVRSLPYQGEAEDLRAKLRGHQIALDQASLALADLQEAMRQRSPRWQAILASTHRIADTLEAQQLVGSHGVMLAYAIGATNSFVFEIPPSGEEIRVHELRVSRSWEQLGLESGPFTRSMAERVVRESRKLLLCSSPLCAAQRDRTLRAVADLIVPEQLRQRLRNSDFVVVAPDGALNALPFEALVFGGPEDRPSSTWLTSTGSTLYASSATALRELRARWASRKRQSQVDIAVLSVSDPDFGPSASRQVDDTPADAAAPANPRIALEELRAGHPLELPRLPGTRRETAAIVEAFAGQRVVVLQDSDATEPAVRAWAPRARLLHLATHGFAEWSGSSSLAALVLSAPDSVRDTADDGLLQSFEIQELTLAAELAVLSACETAIGEHIEGEGVFALGRAFLAAGAARVIATLWPVADDATAELVSTVFREVQAENSEELHGVARMLRRAKLEVAMDARTSAPFYWAPFVLVGVD